jgi:hypothetical protein
MSSKDDEDSATIALRKLHAQMREMNIMLKKMGVELDPVWENEASLKDEIADTHGGPGRFSPETAAIRGPLFEGLTVSNERYGDAKSEYKRIMKLVNAYTREAAILERQLLKVKPKGK